MRKLLTLLAVLQIACAASGEAQQFYAGETAAQADARLYGRWMPAQGRDQAIMACTGGNPNIAATRMAACMRKKGYRFHEVSPEAMAFMQGMVDGLSYYQPPLNCYKVSKKHWTCY